MSDSKDAGFAKFVPGFDFLQNLAKNATQAVPQMPNLSNWIAPTLNEEELDKRISELKTVHFWLDQNSKALGATVQALEVQKMTLATLKNMNLNIADVAKAFTFKATEPSATSVQSVSDKAEALAKTAADATERAEAAAKKLDDAAKPAAPAAAAGLVDPMHLWTSLTQQFQTIAAGAMQEVSKAAATDLGKSLLKDAANPGKSAATSATAQKAPAKKAAAKKAPGKTASKPASKTSPRGR